MMQDFKELYSNLNKDNIKKQWETILKENKKIKIIKFVIMFLLNLCTILFFLFNNIKNLYIGVYACIIEDVTINIIVYLLKTQKIEKNKKLYKNEIVNMVLSNFFNEVCYFPDGQMPMSIYLEGSYESFNYYESNDYIEAKINYNYSIQIGSLLIKSDNPISQSLPKNVFNGIFAKIDLKKSIDNELRICINLRKANEFQTNSSELENYFDISSTNPLIKEQMLSSDIKEKLLEFQKKLPSDVYIKNNKMYIRIHCGSILEKILETNIKKDKTIDEDDIKIYYEIIKYIYSLSTYMIDVIEKI